MKITQIISWLKNKLLNSIISARDKALKKLGRTDFETIYFEGGLGSQILSYLEFLKKPRNIDVSYFENPPIQGMQGPDIWAWELDRYGISIHDLSPYKRTVKFNPWKSRRPSILELSEKESDVDYNSKEINGSNLQSNFPINEIQLQDFINQFKIDIVKLTTVHVRRGDYERVASKILGIKEYFNLLMNISHHISHEIIFLSDTKIPAHEIELLNSTLPDKRLLFFSNEEMPLGLAHDLMRRSKILITANSTFSISAGLLSDVSSLVFSPIMFFGGENGYRNSRLFNRNGDFFVVRK
jgi:hypothetical protein